MAGNTTGPDSLLTKKMLAKIKAGVFSGMNLKELAKHCKVSESTMYHWHSENAANLGDKIEGWRRDSKLEQADRNIDTILKLDATDKDFTKSVSDMSKFVKETLDKPNYSKRNEHTGADGKELTVNIVNYADPVQLPSASVSTTALPKD